MMKNHLLILLLLVTHWTFAQSKEDDYKLYSLILKERLELGVKWKADTAILIEEHKGKINHYELFDLSSDSITATDLHFLLINTGKDTVFIKRLMKEPELKRVIVGLASDFENHPKIEADKLASENLHLKTITSKIYYSYFRNNSRQKNGWKRISKKYGTTNVVEFSKINYSENLAAVYYGFHCGGLCGTGSIVVFEKVDDQWRIVTEINLWMS